MEANADDFVLNCGDLYAIVLSPTDANGNPQQTIIIFDKYNCDIVSEETAWGEGPGFPGSNWAMYFEYSLQGNN